MPSSEPILYREPWHSHPEPIRVGRSLLIVPQGVRLEAQPGERRIDLDLTPDDPWTGAVFGSGAHPTTHLALTLLEAHLSGGERVLDLGTGSGILALAAARLGAGPILALDIDRASVSTARANVALNGLAGTIEVREGSLEAARGGDYCGAVILRLFRSKLPATNNGPGERALA